MEVSVSVPLLCGPDPEVSLLSFTGTAAGCGRGGVLGGLFWLFELLFRCCVVVVVRP